MIMTSPLIFSVVLIFCGTVFADTDILNSVKGIEKFIPGHPRNISDRAEFLPASKGIIKTEDGIFINIPPDKASGSFRYAGLGIFKLQAGKNYKISCGIQNKYYCKFLLLGTFFKDGSLKHGRFLSIADIKSYSFIKIEKDFAVPPDTNRMILWTGVQADKGKLLSPGAAVFIKNLRIREQEPFAAKAEFKSSCGINLLQIENFQSFKTGKVDYDSMQLVNRGPEAYNASIVDAGKGIKVLSVKYKKGDYPYVHFLGRKAPLFGRQLRFSCRIRGKGKISLGIWWNRKRIGSYYQHSKIFPLNEQWQDVNITYACNEPLSESAAASITCRGDELNFQVSKIKLEIIAPYGIKMNKKE